MGPLGGFWPKLGRKRVTGWKQRSCVPEGRVKTNKQTNKEVGDKIEPYTIVIRAFRTSESESESADFSEVRVRKFRTLKTLRTRTQRVC
jgi:hypothetical protein